MCLLSLHLLTPPPWPGRPAVPPAPPSCLLFRRVKTLNMLHTSPLRPMRRALVCLWPAFILLLPSVRPVITCALGFIAKSEAPPPSLWQRVLSFSSQTYQQQSSVQSKNRRKNKGELWGQVWSPVPGAYGSLLETMNVAVLLQMEQLLCPSLRFCSSLKKVHPQSQQKL